MSTSNSRVQNANSEATKPVVGVAIFKDPNAPKTEDQTLFERYVNDAQEIVLLYAQKGSPKAAYSVAQNELSARHIAEEKALLESLKQRQQAELNALRQAWSQELAIEHPLDKEYDEAKDIRFEQWRVDDQEEKMNRWGWRNSSAGTAMAERVRAHDQQKQEIKQRKQAFEQSQQKT